MNAAALNSTPGQLDIEEIDIGEIDIGEPGSREVLIRIAAARARAWSG